MIPSIETDRLLLRAPDENDFPTYESFFADGEASRFYGGPMASNRAWSTLAADLGHWQLRGYGRWAIELKENGEMVGGCGLVWPGGWPRSELTWWVVPSARRKGIAKEASRAAIAYGYEELGWDIVQTHMDDENQAARALVESLGGKVLTRAAFPDGKERDVYSFPRQV